MKKEDFKDGTLFTVGQNKTVLKFGEWKSDDGHAYQSIQEYKRDWSNRYSVDMNKTGLRLYDYIGGAEVKGFIAFSKCVAVEAVVTVNQPLTVNEL